MARSLPSSLTRCLSHPSLSPTPRSTSTISTWTTSCSSRLAPTASQLRPSGTRSMPAYSLSSVSTPSLTVKPQAPRATRLEMRRNRRAQPMPSTLSRWKKSRTTSAPRRKSSRVRHSRPSSSPLTTALSARMSSSLMKAKRLSLESKYPTSTTWAASLLTKMRMRTLLQTSQRTL